MLTTTTKVDRVDKRDRMERMDVGADGERTKAIREILEGMRM